MKLLTEQQFQEHQRASVRGAIEGAAVGSALAGASYMYMKRFAGYRSLPPSLKLLGAIIITAPIIAIQGERRGLEYDRSQWQGQLGVDILDHKELQEDLRWNRLSLGEKVKDWSLRHQYTLIMGGWAGSLGVAAAIISRNKYQTLPQKIVQARMWAQGLTIGLLIAAGALTFNSRKEIAAQHNNDHSWRDVIEYQERERKAEEEALRRQSGSSPATVA